ncbi:S8 family serine peptidase [Polaribacter sp.]|uniref:S8 family serine peptidase n=1 Tax=Polaribacter sp. TaxID=1920175 RepID=UPI003EF1E84F
MKKLLLFLFLTTFLQLQAQEDAWVYLKDKPNKDTFLANPLTMLSQRALDRRTKLNVSLDAVDVPIDENYYTQLKNTENITVLAKSKWLNAIHVQGEVSDINNLVTTYSFIASIEFANKSLNTGAKSLGKPLTPNHYNKFLQAQTAFDYGEADNQIKMLKGDFLHEQGLTGHGQLIAVIDAGFPNVNTLAAFQRVRDNNQILGGYNFADRNTDIYTRSSHGTHVLSFIAGYLENEFVGTAPDASFYLFISEITETETVLEETLWVEAAERADSLGVDVINTSLGYTTFDNANHNHTYEDMDGKTTFISRGAELATSKGMLVVNSAGNDGDKEWKYIGAPADAASVITIGAVNASGEIASFSSFGPTSDGRIKPEIVAQGERPSFIDYESGEVSTAGSGTSFSSPIMTGLIACLNGNEGFALRPESTDAQNLNDNLKSSIYQSANQFSSPTDQYGYGIPNFETALNLYVASTGSVNDNLFKNLSVYPNPTEQFINIMFKNGSLQDFTLEIYDVLGKKVLKQSNATFKTINVSFLENGIYMLKVSKDNQYKTLKLIKK